MTGLAWSLSGDPVQLQRLVGIDEQAAPEVVDEDPRLKEPGVMRATTWSLCRACDSTIAEREVQALVDLPELGRSWVHIACAPEPEGAS